MKLSDLVAGETYWHYRGNDWASQTGLGGWDSMAVRVDDPATRYHYSEFGWGGSNNPDNRARAAANGKYVRGVLPADPNSEVEAYRVDRPTYVLPRMLRCTWAEAVALTTKNREARQDQAARTAAENQAVDVRAANLRDRAQAAGLPVTVSALHVGYNRSRAVVTVTMGSDDLAALLDRLDAVEVGRAGAFAAGIDRGDAYGEISPDDRRQAYEDYITRLTTSTMTAVQAADTIAAVNQLTDRPDVADLGARAFEGLTEARRQMAEIETAHQAANRTA